MSFVKRNLVSIVMIPSIILLHYGWQRMQYMDELVPAHERKEENPAIAAPAAVFAYLTGRYKEQNNEKPKSDQ